jgi:hypothetical protein
MDIEGKWVHFEDAIELEFFLNICEEKSIRWVEYAGYSPREFIKEDLEIFKRGAETGPVLCGYLVAHNMLHGVCGGQDLWRSEVADVTQENRFYLTGD